MQHTIHASPDIAYGLTHETSRLPLRRIDVYIDRTNVWTFFVSTEYCELVGIAPAPFAVCHLADEDEFNKKMTWEPGVGPCCGECFYTRYPEALGRLGPSPPPDLIHGYIISEIKS